MLRVTPAMAAGASAHVWEIADVIKLVEAAEIEHKANAFGTDGSVLGAESRRR
jgi:hypothetical protein